MTGQLQPTRWRKKPVVVEAMRWDGTPEGADAIVEWAGVEDHRWLKDLLLETTDEGIMWARPGDYIIRGARGWDLLPCKPDDFAETYEPAQDPQAEALPTAAAASRWRDRVTGEVVEALCWDGTDATMTAVTAWATRLGGTVSWSWIAPGRCFLSDSELHLGDYIGRRPSDERRPQGSPVLDEDLHRHQRLVDRVLPRRQSPLRLPAAHGRHSLAEEPSMSDRCDLTDLLVDQCACADHRGEPAPAPRGDAQRGFRVPGEVPRPLPRLRRQHPGGRHDLPRRGRRRRHVRPPRVRVSDRYTLMP